MIELYFAIKMIWMIIGLILVAAYIVYMLLRWFH